MLKAFRWRYAFLFLFALSLRLLYVFQQSANNPLFDFPVVDAKVYSDWADEIAMGKWGWAELRNYLPVYPWFLAICKWFFWGDYPWGVKVVQSLLSSVACVLWSMIAERAFGKRVGFFAGLLFSSYWMFILYDAERFAESFSLSTLVFAFYFLSGEIRWRHIIGAAIFSSLSTACRPNLIPLLLVFAGWIYVSQPKENRKLIPSIVFLSVASLLFLLVLYHNHSLTGTWTLRAQQNWNFYAAVDPSMGGLSPAAGIDFDQYMLKPVLQGYHTHEEQDAYWGAETLKLIRDQPMPVFKNFFFDRGMIFLSATEWSQEFDVDAYRNYSSLLRFPWPSFGWILPLAVVGFFAMGKRMADSASLVSKRRFLAVGLIVAIMFTFISKVTGRYRLPVVLFLIPFAAAGIEQILISAGRKRVCFILIFFIAGACSWIDWMNLSRRQTAMHDFYIGQKFQKLGQLDEAEQAFRMETYKQPWNANAPNEWARVLWRKNQIPQALAVLSQAVVREPQFWNAWTLKGSLELEQKEYAEALSSLDQSLMIYPLQSAPWMLKQQIYAETQKWELEREAFEKAMEYGAGPLWVLSYALRLEDQGLFQEALKQYQSVAMDSSLLPIHRARAYLFGGYLVFVNLKDEKRAREFWGKIRSDFPDGYLFFHQSRFLLGEISESDYQAEASRSQSENADVFYDFDCGLRWLMNHDRVKAREAFQRCIAKRPSSTNSPSHADIPEKWARRMLQN